MKKLKFILFILLASTLTFVACDKDDDGDDTPEVKDMRLYKIINKDGGTSTDGEYKRLVYNADNNIIKIEFVNSAGQDLAHYYGYEYTGKNMTTYTYFNGAKVTSKLMLTYVDDKPSTGMYQVDNGSGLEDYYEHIYTFSGDKLVQLDFMKDVSGVPTALQQFKYSYSGDNVSKVVMIGYGGTDAGNITYTYDGKKNPIHGKGIDFVLGEVEYMSPSNVTKNTKIVADVVVEPQSFNNTYEYNDNDEPTKKVSNSFDNNIKKDLVFEYQEK